MKISGPRIWVRVRYSFVINLGRSRFLVHSSVLTGHRTHHRYAGREPPGWRLPRPAESLSCAPSDRHWAIPQLFQRHAMVERCLAVVVIADQALIIQYDLSNGLNRSYSSKEDCWRKSSLIICAIMSSKCSLSESASGPTSWTISAARPPAGEAPGSRAPAHSSLRRRVPHTSARNHRACSFASSLSPESGGGARAVIERPQRTDHAQRALRDRLREIAAGRRDRADQRERAAARFVRRAGELSSARLPRQLTPGALVEFGEPRRQIGRKALPPGISSSLPEIRGGPSPQRDVESARSSTSYPMSR